jgi:hypothetical protein
MKRKWQTPQIAKLSEIPTTFGDCEGGSSETYRSCENGQNTGPGPEANHCYTGTIALAGLCAHGETPSAP